MMARIASYLSRSHASTAELVIPQPISKHILSLALLPCFNLPRPHLMSRSGQATMGDPALIISTVLVAVGLDKDALACEPRCWSNHALAKMM